jgi:hypothetical protein
VETYGQNVIVYLAFLDAKHRLPPSSATRYHSVKCLDDEMKDNTHTARQHLDNRILELCVE